MIVKTPDKIEIGPDDRASLKQFLDSQHGKVILLALGQLAPEMSDIGTSEVMINSGAQRKGYELAIENLFSFIARTEDGPVATPATEYPSLDDDTAWKELEQSEEKKPA